MPPYVRPFSPHHGGGTNAMGANCVKFEKIEHFAPMVGENNFLSKKFATTICARASNFCTLKKHCGGIIFHFPPTMGGKKHLWAVYYASGLELYALSKTLPKMFYRSRLSVTMDRTLWIRKNVSNRGMIFRWFVFCWNFIPLYSGRGQSRSPWCGRLMRAATYKHISGFWWFAPPSDMHKTPYFKRVLIFL